LDGLGLEWAGKDTQEPGGIVTILVNRANTALLVVDMQVDVVLEAYRRDAVVATIAALVEKARAAGVAVVWVQHSSEELLQGSDGWQYVPELARRDSEPLVAKEYSDAFEATELETVLAARGIGRLFLAGAQTDECIRSTLHGAITRGYDVTLVADAHTTEDLSQFGAPPPELVVAHTNLYWQYHRAPGRTAETVNAADADFASRS
jgi:isochorismate hydrolase